MNINIFRLDPETHKIIFNKWKFTLRFHDPYHEGEHSDQVFYFNDDELYEYEVNRVPKHRCWEIVSKEEIDPGEYSWMEGIVVATDGNMGEEIKRIAKYGSREAYDASLETNRDSYYLDLDYRISKIELGV